MTIRRLSREHKSEAVKVLAAAFYDYPVMRYVLKSSTAEYDRDLEALIGFFCEIRLLRNFPFLGVDSDGSLAAVALINDPAPQPWPLPESALQQLSSVIGDAALKRLERYEQLSADGEPPTPHFFLGMIGVHPDHQKKGLAGILLDEVRAMSDRHPGSSGVCLSTETPVNVVLYERFGYRVISEADVDELHSWCMFLPKEKQDHSRA